MFPLRFTLLKTRDITVHLRVVNQHAMEFFFVLFCFVCPNLINKKKKKKLSVFFFCHSPRHAKKKRMSSSSSSSSSPSSSYNPVAELNRLLAEFGSHEKMRVELRPVADHDCWGDPSKALFKGAADGNLSLIRAALCSGMNPDTFFKGQSPLMFAAESGHVAACLLLIANGASVNLVDRYNRTALHYAARNKNVGCAAALMDSGAKNDVECDLGGETASDLAKISGDRQLIRFVNFHEQNVDEIRNVVLKDEVQKLREVESLALMTTSRPKKS